MKIKIKASLTVEAVFIMPITLFTIVFIVYLSFYLHDYCKIQGITDMVLHKAAINLKHDADIGTGRVHYDEINKGLISQIFGEQDSIEAEIENHIRSLLSKGLIATRIAEVHASKGVLNLSIRVEGSFIFPLKGLQWFIPLGNTFVIKAESPYHYPANFVRISEVILDTGSKIKGFDKIKDCIGRLMP